MLIVTPVYWNLNRVGPYEEVREFQPVRGRIPTSRSFFGVCESQGEQIFLKVGNPIDPEAVQRIDDEVKFLQRLQSTHVVKLLGFGLQPVKHGREVWEFPYIALEYVDYCLFDLLGNQDWRLGLAVAQGTYDAIAHLHSAGVVHGDLSPINVLVSKDLLAVRLCDFDCATQADQFRRAPDRCGPHQPPDQQVTPAFDVFSFAGLVHSLFAVGDFRRFVYAREELIFHGHIPEAAKAELGRLLVGLTSLDVSSRLREFRAAKDVLNELRHEAR